MRKHGKLGFSNLRTLSVLKPLFRKETNKLWPYVEHNIVRENRNFVWKNCVYLCFPGIYICANKVFWTPDPLTPLFQKNKKVLTPGGIEPWYLVVQWSLSTLTTRPELNFLENCGKFTIFVGNRVFWPQKRQIPQKFPKQSRFSRVLCSKNRPTPYFWAVDPLKPLIQKSKKNLTPDGIEPLYPLVQWLLSTLTTRPELKILKFFKNCHFFWK